MNFIEKVLGLSPDNGSGATEITVFLGLSAVLIVAWLFYHEVAHPVALLRNLGGSLIAKVSNFEPKGPENCFSVALTRIPDEKA